jgi:hypothetical protein
MLSPVELFGKMRLANDVRCEIATSALLSQLEQQEQIPLSPASPVSIYAWNENMCMHESYLWDSIAARTPDIFANACEFVNAKYTSHMNMLNWMKTLPEFPPIAFDRMVSFSKSSFVGERRNMALETTQRSRANYLPHYEMELDYFTQTHTLYPNLQQIASLADQLNISDSAVHMWFVQRHSFIQLNATPLTHAESSYATYFPYTQQQQQNGEGERTSPIQMSEEMGRILHR